MDKRWIIIIIILLIGTSSLFLIVKESNDVGVAITTIKNVVVTLPNDFRTGHEGETSVELTNRGNDEVIYIELIKEKNKAFKLMKNELNELKQSDSISDIENTTTNISNITVYSIKYQNFTTGNPVNQTMSYFNKLNKTFIVGTSGYTDSDEENSDLSYIVNTLRLDFKVKDN